MKRIICLLLLLGILWTNALAAFPCLESGNVQGGSSAETVLPQTQTITVKGSSNQEYARMGYFKFDISGIDKARLKKATLHLYTSGENQSLSLDLYQTHANWSADSLTWNNRPQDIGFLGRSNGASMGIMGTAHAFDITQAVLKNNSSAMSVSARDGQNSDKLIALWGSGASNPSLRPRIDISYQEPQKAIVMRGSRQGNTISFDLSRINSEIAYGMLSVLPTSGTAPVAITVKQDGKEIFSRTVNTIGQTLYLDVSAYVTGGKAAVFELVSQAAFAFDASELTIGLKEVLAFARRTDFENGGLDGFAGYETAKSGNLSVVDNPNGEGKVLRAYLHHSDGIVADSKRTELVLDNLSGVGSEFWYTFRIYVPSDYVVDSNLEIITQWHVAPDKNLGEVWRSPPLGMKITGEHFAVSNRWDPKPATVGNDPRPEGGINDNIGLGKWEAGKWTDWVFHVKWSYQEDGILEIWRDGRQVVNKKGPTTYNDQSRICMKHGIYKGGYKSETDYGRTEFRELFFDHSMTYYHDEILREVLPNQYPAAVKLQLYEGRLSGKSPVSESLQAGYNTIETKVQNMTGTPREMQIVTQLIKKSTGEAVNESKVVQRLPGEGTDVITTGFKVPADCENYEVTAFAADVDGHPCSNRMTR